MSTSGTWFSGFDPAFIDFDRGIRMGKLDPSQRITQIIKIALVERFAVDFICDRWGRGMYWQWICWVPRPNRDAKPLSSGYNFGSLKFFISADAESRVFKAGLQIERAPKKSEGDGVELEKDWDWNVMLKAMKDKRLPREISRLLKDGFRLRIGAFSSMKEYRRSSWNLQDCLRTARNFDAEEWGGFQLFWGIHDRDLRTMSGADIIETILAVFEELVPIANLCSFNPCLGSEES